MNPSALFPCQQRVACYARCASGTQRKNQPPAQAEHLLLRMARMRVPTECCAQSTVEDGARVATARGGESPRACNGAQREWKAPSSAQTERSAVRKTGDTLAGASGQSPLE